MRFLNFEQVRSVNSDKQEITDHEEYNIRHWEGREADMKESMNAQGAVIQIEDYTYDPVTGSNWDIIPYDPKTGLRDGTTYRFETKEWRAKKEDQALHLAVSLDYKSGKANGFLNNYHLNGVISNQKPVVDNMHHGVSRSFDEKGNELKGPNTRYYWKGKEVPQALYWMKANAENFYNFRLGRLAKNLFARNGDDVAAKKAREDVVQKAPKPTIHLN
jgi:hypothetical protein